MLSNSDFNLSQGLFMDLVSNVKAIKSGSNNAFLIYPRILSVILQKVLPEKVFKKGEAMQMKSLTSLECWVEAPKKKCLKCQKFLKHKQRGQRQQLLSKPLLLSPLLLVIMALHPVL